VSTQGERTFRALNILTKWRTIFAGWPVTREDGCTLYQPLDGLHPAAVWLSEGADPDPRQYRALYAADWPEGASA
jgi:hypothetical protein